MAALVSLVFAADALAAAAVLLLSAPLALLAALVSLVFAADALAAAAVALLSAEAAAFSARSTYRI